MSILICSTKYGGCGYIGFGETFGNLQDKDGEDLDVVLCPKCDDDHSFQLTQQNIDSLTDSNNHRLAISLLALEKESESWVKQ